jgi:ribose 5-phosphate isomerase B
MKLVMAADHAGFPLKEEVRGYLDRVAHQVLELGACSIESSDYADYADTGGRALIARRGERGILTRGAGLTRSSRTMFEDHEKRL